MRARSCAASASTTRRRSLAQYAVKEDEAKFLATSREAAEQLEKLFDADRTTKVK